MNAVFKPYLRKFVLVFFDDILIYSTSQEEHVKHVALVLQSLKENCLVANFKKCAFGKKKIEYLGHVISEEGVAADVQKLKAMMEWKIPTNLRELRGLLGLTGYYRKFIARYAQIAQPLTNQLKKDKFGWSNDATDAFEHLKQAMITSPVLALPNFSMPLLVESGYGIGAVLVQQGRPIAFFSKLLGPKAC